nr:MAG TPA: DNA polymerase I [Caudoviricetes sp.]
MRKKLYIDFETFSDVDLKARGAYNYMRGAFWEALICTYRWGEDGETQILQGEDIIPFVRETHDDEDVVFIAHNASFERLVYTTINDYPLGEFMPPERFIDTMAMARCLGFPGGLGKLAKALGVEEKDSAGTRLINMFCVPDKRGHWHTPQTRPTDWKRFCDYAVQDVDTLVAVHKAMEERYGGFPPGEQQVWYVDQRINDRGILADVNLARRGIEIAEAIKNSSLRGIEEYAKLENGRSQKQVFGWVADQLLASGIITQVEEGVYIFPDTGEPFDTIDKKMVSYLLDRDDIPTVVRDVLNLRAMSNAASVAKFNAYLRLSDPFQHRVRGAMQFFGAHTGRWAGRGVQFQNLPRNTAGGEEETEALVAKAMSNGGYDLTLDDLKPLIRACVTAPEGKELTVCDYSAIEARVIAWLAGEEWVLEAFREGRDIYVETASRMFHVPYEEAKALRSKGKVAVLALGYNGGVNALRVMGGEGSDEELQELVWAWRAANPNIARFWKDLEGAFRLGYGKVGQFLEVQSGANNARRIVLPSGRAVYYHEVHTRPMMKFGKVFQVLHFKDPKNISGSAWLTTYGGKLSENVTQAVARDVLANALINLEEHGAEVVAHVHDEVICQSGLSVDRVAELMGVSGSPFFPSWAEGLPLAAAGYTCKRYRKE